MVRAKKKKAQEEMLGFAFIVLLVVVIGIVFLFISIKSQVSVSERENVRVNNLLNGISYFTTECEAKNIQQLIIACEEGELLDCGGGDACELVKEEVGQILQSALRGDYAFTVKVKGAYAGDLIELKKGVCPGKGIASSAISNLPGNIEVKLLSCPEPD